MLKRTLNVIHAHRYGFALTGLLFMLCIAPLLRADFYTGHDFNFHLCRISGISDNISNGKWFSPLYHNFFQGYGYAAPLFYGDIFLHIPGFLVSRGMEITQAFKLYILLVAAATAFSAYACGKAVFKDKAAAYTFSSYFVVDAIVRTAVGELTAFIFLPILFLGFYSVVFDDMKKWHLLPLGLAGCLVSHVLSAVISAFILAVFALLCIKRLFAEKSAFFIWVFRPWLSFVLRRFSSSP